MATTSVVAIIYIKKNYFFVAQKTVTIMALHMKIVLCMWECIESGSVHFWCIFFGYKKTYKIENQILVGLLLRRAGLASLRSPIQFYHN